jgi:two-component system, cell cycle sensor histidine kinase DivJ
MTERRLEQCAGRHGVLTIPEQRVMNGQTSTAKSESPAKPAMIGESEAATAFERSRIAALFIAALLVPALLVLEGPRDWRLALLASTPTIPAVLALLTVRGFGVDTALAVQFGIGTVFATVAAMAGFGFAVPALIVALMVIDSLLIGRRISGSPLVAGLIAASGLLCIVVGTVAGGFEAVDTVRSTLIWLVIPSLVQLGTAIVVWRRSTAWRRKSDHDPMGVLHRSVDRAQREVGFLLDPHGRSEDVTGNVRDVMGLRATDALGRGLIDRLHVLDRPGFLKAVAEAASDSLSSVLRLRFTRLDVPDGDRTFRWFEGRVFPVTGQSSAALLMIRDINEEMSILTADSDRRKKSDEERQRRASFLADLSHDVRTPLNAIIGFSELLANPSTQPREAVRITEYASIVHRSGRDLLEVVTMLVEMTRVENGAFEFIEEPAKPAVLIDGLRETLAEAVERPDLRVHLKGELASAEWLVDRRAARQVLFGIGSTIIDQQSTANLCVTLSNTDDEIVFAFSPCEEAENRPAGRRTVTAGLSMEVAKALVAIMGGELAFDETSSGINAQLRLPIGGRGQGSAPDRAEPVALVDLRSHRPSTATPETVDASSPSARRNHG